MLNLIVLLHLLLISFQSSAETEPETVEEKNVFFISVETWIPPDSVTAEEKFVTNC